MQNVTIQEIALQDRSVEESLSAINRFLRNGALDVVSFVDQRVLISAFRDDNTRDFLSKSAITEWLDKSLLSVVGIHDEVRAREVENRSLWTQCLHNIVGTGAEVVVAGVDTTEISRLHDELSSVEPDIRIIHDLIIDLTDDSKLEHEINGINEHAPALIISRVDYSVLQSWLARARAMINASVWIAMPEHVSLAENKGKSILGILRDSIANRMLATKIRK